MGEMGNEISKNYDYSGSINLPIVGCRCKRK